MWNYKLTPQQSILLAFVLGTAAAVETSTKAIGESAGLTARLATALDAGHLRCEQHEAVRITSALNRFQGHTNGMPPEIVQQYHELQNVFAAGEKQAAGTQAGTHSSG